MPTQKQERFTRNLFEGMNQSDAYREAGYDVAKQTLATIHSNASRLANNVKVLERLEELRRKAEDETVAVPLERKQVLTEILRARLTDYTTCGSDRDLINVGPESPNTAALQEITSRTEYGEDGAGFAVITKLKLYNPITAIDTLNKMDRLYSETFPQGDDNRTYNFFLTGEAAKQGLNALLSGKRDLLPGAKEDG